mgnify:CR=1 FL=1
MDRFITNSSKAWYGRRSKIIDKKINQNDYFSGVSPKMLFYRAADSFGEFNQLPDMLQKPPIKSKPAIKGQLTSEQTRTKLAEAVKLASKTPGKKASGVFYPETASWDLNNYMDATSFKNSEYLALAPAGGKTVIMHRTDGEKNWAHATLKNIRIDLDKYPVLNFVLEEKGAKGPYQIALKMVDEDRGVLYMLTRRNSRMQHRYDLRKLGLTGKRNLSLLVYYIPRIYVPPTPGKSYAWKNCEPGDYFTIKELNFQPEK